MNNKYRNIFIHVGIPIFLGSLLTLLLVFFTRFQSPAQIHWHLFIAIGLAIWLIWLVFYKVTTSKLRSRTWNWTSSLNFLLGIIFGVLIFDAVYVLLKYFEIWFYGSIDYLQIGHIIAASGVGLFATLVVGGIQAAIFLITFWLEEKINREKTEKELNQNQLHLLRQQLDPHFVFNSFSTLDALIHKDPTQASNFLHQLSKFYHKVLSTYNKDLISIAEEIELVSQYVNLLAIRFPKGLNVDISSYGTLELKIPPLTIQSLVENAVKHNSISSDKPLNIEISINKNEVVITNNKQLKSRLEMTSKIGLNNLKKRFTLHNKAFSIKETSSQFKVYFEPIL